jgi:hypothetical protein
LGLAQGGTGGGRVAETERRVRHASGRRLAGRAANGGVGGGFVRLHGSLARLSEAAVAQECNKKSFSQLGNVGEKKKNGSSDSQEEEVFSKSQARSTRHSV